MTALAGQPWLAVIDMQRVFADPGSPWHCPRLAEITEPVERLAKAFRPRVTFTRFVAPAAPGGAWRSYYGEWTFALQQPDAPLYQIVDELAGLAGETLDKTTFGKWGPELAARVGAGGQLVLAGVSTDCCLLSTAVAAADAGISVKVVAGACAAATDESHQAALTIFSYYAPLIEVVGLAGALEMAAAGPGAAASGGTGPVASGGAGRA
jgi:nicotinamidase-related amidase